MENFIYYIYVYCDPRFKDNFVYGKYIFEYKPFYIGFGKKGRWKDHLHPSVLKNEKTKKRNLIVHLLENNINPIIFKLHTNLEKIEALNKEKEIIKLIGRSDLKQGPLLNLTEGGDHPIEFSDEVKWKMGATNRGKKPWNYGKKLPSLTEEHKQKMSEKLKGKQSKTKKKIQQLDLEGNLIKIWNSIKEASTLLNIHKYTISSCCSNKHGYKSAGGFKWQYFQEI